MSDEKVKVKVVEKPREIRGGRNLMLLGMGSIVLALITSAVSLFIYHATGDIYLDRSRPGFISDEEKKDMDKPKDEKPTYVFSPDGAVTEEVLEEYLEEFDRVVQDIEDASGAFSPDALSDEALGIDE